MLVSKNPIKEKIFKKIKILKVNRSFSEDICICDSGQRDHILGKHLE